MLIVDDEEPGRETLKYLINWERTSFCIAGFAKNGREALNEYFTLKPDLIITDIQMPLMDGLELIKSIRAQDKNQKFVILSCHEEFKYAKEAIRYGISDYLLKDLLTPQDLYSLLEKIKIEIEYENRIKLDDGTNKFYNSLSFNENFYKEECKNIALKDITFDDLTEESLKYYIREFNLNFSTKFYVVLGIVIDDYVKFTEKIDKMQEKYKKYEILRVIKSVLDEFNSGECFYDEKGIFIAVAGIENTNSELYFMSSCHAIANRIHTNIMKHNNITVTIGTSSSFSNLKDIKTKYNEALNIAKYRVFLGKGKTILHNVKSVKAVGLNPVILDKLLNEIRTSLEKGEIEKTKSLIKNIYNDEIKGFAQYNHLKYVNSQMFGIIVEFCSKNNISYSKIFSCEYLPMEKLDEFETVQEMSDWFNNIMEIIVSSNITKLSPIYSKHVSNSIKYIKDNYSKKLGLSQISQELDINKAYFCRIFKQETGENLTDYINKIRIEKAKQLMMSTNDKMYEIAEKVGFTNIQHFNSSFKKVTDQNPLKFKNNIVI